VHLYLTYVHVLHTPIIYADHFLLCMLATNMIRIVDQEYEQDGGSKNIQERMSTVKIIIILY
jgi:hypothetical protein